MWRIMAYAVKGVKYIVPYFFVWGGACRRRALEAAGQACRLEAVRSTGDLDPPPTRA